MPRQPTIVVLTAENETMLPGLDSIAGETVLQHANTRGKLENMLPAADILIVTDFRTRMLKEVWPSKHSIRWVHATSAGIDVLAFPELLDSNITLTNARGVFNRGIAEYVLGAVLMFAKDTMTNLKLQQQHQWRHRETNLIQQQRALIVGAGSIGTDVAKLLHVTGMHVTGIANCARDNGNFDAVHSSEKLISCLPNADYVVIAAPLTEQTRGLFNATTFRHMKANACLINVGRGPIVVTQDLIDALQNKIIAGAALDVFEQEPLPEHSPMWDMPNVMISAHMAGDFKGWRKALGEQFVDNFRRWQQRQPLLNVIDKQKLHATT